MNDCVWQIWATASTPSGGVFFQVSGEIFTSEKQAKDLEPFYWDACVTNGADPVDLKVYAVPLTMVGPFE